MKTYRLYCALSVFAGINNLVWASQAPAQLQQVHRIMYSHKQVDNSLNDALFKTAEHGNLSDMEKFFAGATIPDINARNKDQLTPLIVALENNKHQDVIAYLIDSGASVDIQDPQNRGILHITIMNSPYGNTDIIQKLIDAGADVNAINSTGSTPLMFAALMLVTNAVKQLIAAGADQTIKNKHNQTAYDIAKQHKREVEFNQGVEAGLAERKAYLDRRDEAKTKIDAAQHLLPDINNIVFGYAYGSPEDLPASKTTNISPKSENEIKENHAVTSEAPGDDLPSHVKDLLAGFIGEQPQETASTTEGSLSKVWNYFFK